ncbi:MAG: hypothetical protein SPK09_03555, partial [Porphyromonas sp.]|nr:hypothetical protein [Porphyromonas sp.]
IQSMELVLISQKSMHHTSYARKYDNQRDLRFDDMQRIESEIIDAYNGIGIRYRNKENFSAMQSEVAA